MRRVFVIAALTLLAALPAGTRGDVEPDPGTAAPAPELASLLAGFASLPGLSARFEEEKHLALLVEPLVSRGAIHFAPPDLLLRRTESPVVATLLVRGEELVIREAAGERRMALSAHPLIRAFADTFRGILGGDVALLRRLYRIEIEASGASASEDWELRLEPLGPPLAAAIERVVVRGRGRVLRELAIRDTRGGDTLTRFSAVDVSRVYSDSERRELFTP